MQVLSGAASEINAKANEREEALSGLLGDS